MDPDRVVCGAARRFAGTSDWEAVNTEVPYFTRCPVVTPKVPVVAEELRAGCFGGHQWIDLCCRSPGHDEYPWIDLKVRGVRADRQDRAQRGSALAAYKRDIGALAGFETTLTSRLSVEQPGVAKAD